MKHPAVAVVVLFVALWRTGLAANPSPNLVHRLYVDPSYNVTGLSAEQIRRVFDISRAETAELAAIEGNPALTDPEKRATLLVVHSGYQWKYEALRTPQEWAAIEPVSLLSEWEWPRPFLHVRFTPDQQRKVWTMQDDFLRIHNQIAESPSLPPDKKRALLYSQRCGFIEHYELIVKQAEPATAETSSFALTGSHPARVDRLPAESQPRIMSRWEWPVPFRKVTLSPEQQARLDELGRQALQAHNAIVADASLSSEQKRQACEASHRSFFARFRAVYETPEDALQYATGHTHRP